jgi:hypothetical protein
MKITNRNIIHWLAALFSTTPIISYSILGFCDLTIVLSLITVILWVCYVIWFIMLCQEDEIEFEIKIPIPFYDSFKRKQKLRKKIQLLKLEALNSIRNEAEYKRIINQIAEIQSNDR